MCVFVCVARPLSLNSKHPLFDCHDDRHHKLHPSISLWKGCQQLSLTVCLLLFIWNLHNGKWFIPILNLILVFWMPNSETHLHSSGSAYRAGTGQTWEENDWVSMKGKMLFQGYIGAWIGGTNPWRRTFYLWDALVIISFHCRTKRKTDAWPFGSTKNISDDKFLFLASLRTYICAHKSAKSWSLFPSRAVMARSIKGSVWFLQHSSCHASFVGS